MSHELLNKLQKTALEQLCGRYEVDFSEDNFHPGLGMSDGWVEGWIGKHIYVGCSPSGEIHS